MIQKKSVVNKHSASEVESFNANKSESNINKFVADKTKTKTLDKNLMKSMKNEDPQKIIAETMMLVAQNQIKASLPKNEPKNFDGKDPTQYQSFIQDFKSMIAKYCDSNSVKLHYLEKYTSGLPLQLVKSCRHQDSSVGYDKAIEILDQEFGNERTITSAYLEKLSNWKPIKNEDGKALRDYKIFLISCNNMIGTYSSLNQLNSPSEIKKNVMKLPFKLREKWRSRVLQIQQLNRLENFDDFTCFVQEQSSLQNLALYEDISDKKTEKTCNKKGTSEVKKNVFSTSIDSTSVCPVCKKSNHVITIVSFSRRRVM